MSMNSKISSKVQEYDRREHCKKQKEKYARKVEQHIIVMGYMNCKTGDLLDGNKEEI